MILILSIFSLITDNEYDFPSNSLSSCEAVFNTSEVAFYYLETLNITGCTYFTNLTKSSFPTGYSITHLKLSYGGLEYVEADSLLVRISKCYFTKALNRKKKENYNLLYFFVWPWPLPGPSKAKLFISLTLKMSAFLWLTVS